MAAYKGQVARILSLTLVVMAVVPVPAVVPGVADTCILKRPFADKKSLVGQEGSGPSNECILKSPPPSVTA